MSSQKLIFDNPENTGVRLKCPHCGEYLYPADLETFSHCCYCNGKIEPCPEIEDFVIAPLARQWAERNNN